MLISNHFLIYPEKKCIITQSHRTEKVIVQSQIYRITRVDFIMNFKTSDCVMMDKTGYSFCLFAVIIVKYDIIKPEGSINESNN